jgi:glutathione S-transferase
MIDLYTAATSNGLRAAIVLAENELPHRVHKIDLSAGDQKKPEFLAMNPLGQIPVLVDHQGPGGQPLTLTESLAIMIYVVEKGGVGLPSEPRARARVFEALFNVMTDVYSPFNALFTLSEVKDSSGEATKKLDGLVKKALAHWDKRLAQWAWLAADYSLADMALYPTLLRLQGALKRKYPDLKNLSRWAEAMANRPAVQDALALHGRP